MPTSRTSSIAAGAGLALGLVVVAGSWPAARAGAEAWPNWRGPQLNGTSADTGLPLRWSVTENVTWKAPMPERSGSTPIVWGDHVFVSVGEGSNLSLWSLDRAQGHRAVEAPARRGQPPDDEAADVVALAGHRRPDGVGDDRHRPAEGDSISAGVEKWSRDIQTEYGRFGLQWGYASSPLLLEDSLVVQVLHGSHTDDPSYVLRIDKMTGKNVWRVDAADARGVRELRMPTRRRRS